MIKQQINSEFPDDIEQIKAMLRKQQSRLRQYASLVAGYEKEIERLKAQLDSHPALRVLWPYYVLS